MIFPTEKEHTLKAIATSSYFRLTAILAVAIPLAITCGGFSSGH